MLKQHQEYLENKIMIKIEKIVWMSKEANEAEIYLSDGKFNIISFSHPFNGSEGDLFDGILYGFNATRIFSSEEKKFSIEKSSDYFGYLFIGILIDSKMKHVKVGEFVIELDNDIPLDILENTYISFECERIDLY